MTNSIPPHFQHKMNLLSQYLVECRFNENLSQWDVSEEIDIHRNTIVRAENGKNITLVSLFILADYYEMPLSDLFSVFE